MSVVLRELDFRSPKTKVVHSRQIELPYVIWGGDLSAVLLWERLRDQFGDDQVKVVFPRKIDNDDLFLFGINTLRGETNLSIFQDLNKNLGFNNCGESQESDAVTAKFFKDHDFRNFNSRYKPEILLSDEKFFTAKQQIVDLKRLLTREVGVVGAELETSRIDLEIESIEYGENCWELFGVDGTLIKAKYLFVANAPFEFYQLFKPKEKLSNLFAEFCKKAQGEKLLIVKFILSKEVCISSGTLFIPQSLTHEWGHFVGEFSKFNRELGVQESLFWTFLAEDSVTDQDISKKIRLMNRVIKRIFPKFADNKKEEIIKIFDSNPCIKIDDELFDKVQGELPNIYFAGYNAPLNSDTFSYARTEISGVARLLTSFYQINKIFSEKKD